ncbi:hypothetical protein ACSQ67_007732 [Phaseolus vulgaris]
MLKTTKKPLPQQSPGSGFSGGGGISFGGLELLSSARALGLGWIGCGAGVLAVLAACEGSAMRWGWRKKDGVRGRGNLVRVVLKGRSFWVKSQCAVLIVYGAATVSCSLWNWDLGLKEDQ